MKCNHIMNKNNLTGRMRKSVKFALARKDSYLDRQTKSDHGSHLKALFSFLYNYCAINKST